MNTLATSNNFFFELLNILHFSVSYSVQARNILKRVEREREREREGVSVEKNNVTCRMRMKRKITHFSLE